MPLLLLLSLLLLLLLLLLQPWRRMSPVCDDDESAESESIQCERLVEIRNAAALSRFSTRSRHTHTGTTVIVFAHTHTMSLVHEPTKCPDTEHRASGRKERMALWYVDNASHSDNKAFGGKVLFVKKEASPAFPQDEA